MSNDKVNMIFSVDQFIQEIFDDTLTDTDRFDSSIVHLIKDHLAQDRVHTKAGNNLADDLVQLAKKRSQGEER